MSGGRGHLNCFMVKPTRTEEQQGEEIAPLPRRLEGADIDDAEHGRKIIVSRSVASFANYGLNT